MNKYSLEAMLNLVANISRTIPNAKLPDVQKNIAKMQRLASSLHKRYEAACNYEWACTEAYERGTEKLENKAVTLGEEIGVKVEHQRDPRGWPLIIKFGKFEERLG